MTFLKRHKNDILLVLVLLVLAGGFWLYTFLSRSPGGEAVVTVSGKEVLRAPLSENGEYTVGEGGSYNLVVVEDGTVRVESASCPDLVCVHTGRIAYVGQSIVCLPNELVVTVEGTAASELDTVSQ